MDTTLPNNYSLSQTLVKDKTESTVPEKEQFPLNQGLSSVVYFAFIAQLIISPMYDIPTNALPDYSIYSHYAQTNQQNEIEFEKGITDVIIAYQSYPANWDGYDGISPSSDTINNTLLFLEKLPLGVAEPRPGLSGDGEVSLFWEKDDVFVDIGFSGDGKYSFYAQDSQDIEYLKDNIDLNDPLPDALINLINI